MHRGELMNEALRKKYIPMTETIYYTLLSVMTPRHGYAVIQYVSGLTGGRLLLGTGTLYTMVGRLTADGIIEAVPDESRKAYRITDMGLELLREETERLKLQLADGLAVLQGERTPGKETCLNELLPEVGLTVPGRERAVNGKTSLNEQLPADGKASPNGERNLNRPVVPAGTGAVAEKQNFEYRGGT